MKAPNRSLSIDKLMKEGTLCPIVRQGLRQNRALLACLRGFDWKIEQIRTNGLDLIHFGNSELMESFKALGPLTLGDQVGTSGYLFNRQDKIIIEIVGAIVILRYRVYASSYGIWETRLQNEYGKINRYIKEANKC